MLRIGNTLPNSGNDGPMWPPAGLFRGKNAPGHPAEKKEAGYSCYQMLLNGVVLFDQENDLSAVNMNLA